MFPKLHSNIKASANLTPKGSHVVVFSLVLMLGICLLAAFILIFFDKNYWPPLIAAVVILIVIVLLWFSSYEDIDSDSVPSVNISSSEGSSSTMLSVHRRGIPNSEEFEMIVRAFSQLRHRSPLPNPDGLIDNTGSPIPNSVETAQERVRTANNQVEKAAGRTYAQFSSQERQSIAIQTGTELERGTEEEIVETSKSVNCVDDSH